MNRNVTISPTFAVMFDGSNASFPSSPTSTMCSAYVLFDPAAELVADAAAVSDTTTVVVTLTTAASVEVAIVESVVDVDVETAVAVAFADTDADTEAVTDADPVADADVVSVPVLEAVAEVADAEELAVLFPNAFALKVENWSPGFTANTMPC